MFEHRLYIAVTGTRRRIRERLMEPAQAAACCASMMDVSREQVLRLAERAENECARTRLALQAKEPAHGS